LPSRTAFPVRCDDIECGHFVHGYSFPAHIRRIRINIVLSASYPPSPSFLSVPPPPACHVAGLDSPLLGIMDTNPVEAPPPSLHPLVAAMTSIALRSPRWAYPPPSPRRLPIFPSRSRPTIRLHTTSSPIRSTNGYLLRRPCAPDGEGFCQPHGLPIRFFGGHASPPIVFQAWNDPLSTRHAEIGLGVDPSPTPSLARARAVRRLL
jgi:hypothetical protein